MSSSRDVVSSGFSSLGHLDGSRALIEIDMVLRDPAAPQILPGPVNMQHGSAIRRLRKSGKKEIEAAGLRKDVEISVKMQQNLNMLSRTSGDTGKWPASLVIRAIPDR